jgi:SAM-dependent methyltransferase
MQLSAEEYDKWYYTEKGKYISGLEKGVLLKMINPPSPPFSKGGLGGILDIGCGTGYFTQFLGTPPFNSPLNKGGYRGVYVIGIDTSVSMIKYARSHAERGNENKGSNIKYLVAEAENLPFKNGSFDISVSITAINFFKYPAKSVSEAVRVSKTRIVLGVLNKWSLLSLFKKIKGFFKETTYSDACFYSQREINNIFSCFPRIKKIYKQHTYFLPFPRIHLILSGLERVMPSWIPFGGFMGITGDMELR